MNLRLFVFGAIVVLGGVIIGLGARLLIGGRIRGRPPPTTTGVVFVVLGALMIVGAIRATFIMSRELEPESFPMSVLDLGASPQPIEQPMPPPPPLANAGESPPASGDRDEPAR